MRGFLRTILLCAAALLSVSVIFAADAPTCKMGNHAMAAQDTTVAANAVAKSTYPIDYCLVTGEKLGGMGEPVVKMYDGREVRFCCAGCIKDFEKNKAKYLKKFDTAIIAKEKASYPLTTCVVSGEKLGDMAPPVDYVYHNQLVRFCCSGCIATFEKDPAKYLAKLTVADIAPKDAPATDAPAPTPGK
jgi:YHS domain-containing protein